MTRFTSFDDALRWFESGGALVPVEQQRAAFTRGRAQFLAFQAPVTDQGVIDLALGVQDALADIDGIAPVLPEHLHVTVRGAGFQVIEKRHADEVLRQDVPRIGERAAPVVSKRAPIEATFGPVNVFPDALVLEVRDDGALATLHAQLAGATGDAAAPADAEYLPHVTLGWFASADVAAPLRERLPSLRGYAPVTATIKRIELARWWFTGVDATEELEMDVVRSYVLRG